jgi:hypothetical protein
MWFMSVINGSSKTNKLLDKSFASSAVTLMIDPLHSTVTDFILHLNILIAQHGSPQDLENLWQNNPCGEVITVCAKFFVSTELFCRFKHNPNSYRSTELLNYFFTALKIALPEIQVD